MHPLQADKHTDRLYEHLRSRHGDSDSGANGYRLQSYFLREQELILAEIGTAATVADLGCGSGLMVKPLTGADPDRQVLGVDYNEIACRDAHNNGINIIRGDVFSLPLRDEVLDRAINCQFLNQQPGEKARHFIREVYRVLKPGGRLILLWRNDRALIHKLAVFVYRYIDRFTGRPEFPYYDNWIDDLDRYSRDLGFQCVKKQLIFPLFRWRFEIVDALPARIFGASCFLVLEK